MVWFMNMARRWWWSSKAFVLECSLRILSFWYCFIFLSCIRRQSRWVEMRAEPSRCSYCCTLMSSRLASNNISNRIFNNVSDSIFIDLQIYPVNDDNLQYLRWSRLVFECLCHLAFNLILHLVLFIILIFCNTLPFMLFYFCIIPWNLFSLIFLLALAVCGSFTVTSGYFLHSARIGRWLNSSLQARAFYLVLFCLQ